MINLEENNIDQQEIRNVSQEKFYTRAIGDDKLILTINTKRAVVEFVESVNTSLFHRLKLNYKNYIIDLSKVIFIDSTFIGMLIKVNKILKRDKKTLLLVSNQNVDEIFSRIGNLTQLFNRYNSLEEAISDIRQRPNMAFLGK